MAKAIYWEKIFKNLDENGNRVPSFPVLVPVVAIVVGDSEPICGLCRETEAKHNKPRRRHPFTHPIGGQTLDVTHINGKTAQYENVQKGKEANCWTEKE